MNLDESAIDEMARAAQHGDELALARLLTVVRPRVLRWALVQTGTPDEAEDITQQVLLRVHGKLADFGFAARFSTWVYSITRTTAADWRRTRQRRAALLDARPPMQRHSAQDDPETGRLVALVRDQLDALPARQREVFDLVDLQGYTPLEVAELLGMNHNTVRVHVLRARRAIRMRILEMHPDIVEELR